VINKNLVFLSYGSSSEYLRAIYCVLSFSAWAEMKMDNFRLIIYTDQPDFFKTYLSGFTIEYFQLSPGMLHEMLAGTGFIHRRKVAVIDMTFRNFPDEDLIFIDSDTFFVNEPKPFLQPIREGVSLMHKKEYTLTEGLELFSSFGQGHYPEAFIKYISGRQFLIGNQPMVFHTNDYSWNSGVVGLPKSFGSYMKDVFELTDAFYAHSKWFVSEQMAFSLILQRTTTIVSTAPYITHYWGAHQKIIADQFINKLITTSAITDLKNRDFMRSSTTKMHHIIECDVIEEQMEIALQQRNFIYAAKKAVQLLFLKYFNMTMKK
jgi:hypothetical protein